MKEKLKAFSDSSLFLPVVALLVLLTFNALFVDGFLTIQLTEDGRLYGRLIDILNRSCSLVILALGMTFVIATAGIDISVGAVVAISAAVVCSLIGGRGDGVAETPMFLAILAAIGVGVLCGIWNGLLVAKFKIQAMVATLILMTAGRGVAQLMTGGQIITVYYKPFEYISGVIPGNILPTNIFIALAMVLLVAFLMKKTSIGLFIQSVGINPTAARYAGINVTMVIFLVYAFSGLCAGVSGLIESSLIRAADANNAGLNMEMDAILAVALGGNSLGGGRFNLAGSIIGAYTIQAITTTMYALGVAKAQAPVYKAIIVILIVVVQSPVIKAYFAKRKAQKASLAVAAGRS